MITVHAGQWYEGTSAERTTISVSTRNGIFFHDTTLDKLFYLFNSDWYGVAGYNPLICVKSITITAAVVAAEQTLQSCDIDANTLQLGGSLQYETVLESANVTGSSTIVRLYITSPTYDSLIYQSPAYVGDDNNFNANYRLHCTIIESGGVNSLVGLITVVSDYQTTVPNVVDDVGVDVALDEDASLYLTVEITSGATTIAQRQAFLYVYRNDGLYSLYGG